MIQTMKKLKSGYINGTRVMLGHLSDFLNTSAITDLSFLGSQEDGYPERLNQAVQVYLDEHLLRSFSQKNTLEMRLSGFRPKNLRRRMSCRGAIKKTRSINVDSEYINAFGDPTPCYCLFYIIVCMQLDRPWTWSTGWTHIQYFIVSPWSLITDLGKDSFVFGLKC